jgi:hypothetical protein
MLYVYTIHTNSSMIFWVTFPSNFHLLAYTCPGPRSDTKGTQTFDAKRNSCSTCRVLHEFAAAWRLAWRGEVTGLPPLAARGKKMGQGPSCDKARKRWPALYSKQFSKLLQTNHGFWKVDSMTLMILCVWCPVLQTLI